LLPILDFGVKCRVFPLNIVSLATAWGPKFGGINAFNRDFAVGLKAELRSGGRVFCAVIDPTDAEIADAESCGVEIVRVRKGVGQAEFGIDGIGDVATWLKSQPERLAIDVWIGHDVVSGAAAQHASAQLGGAAALIHHMSYINYQAFKHNSSVAADSKHFQQRNLFGQNSQLFGVGPLLQRSCRDLAGRPAMVLIPGFPDIPAASSPNDAVVGVTFGRLDSASERIKQGRLAVAGFGDAIRRSRVPGARQKTLARPHLYFIGLEADSRSDENEIQSLADKHARRVVNVIALPFDHDRHRLYQRLGSSNLAMMLSWHEGFGLTGWEAIAAEVPLILSQHSGLYELIASTLHGAGKGCVLAVDLQGQRGGPGEENFTPDDLTTVSDHIVNIAADLEEHKENARILKGLLVQKLGCTWRDTARQFLRSTRLGMETKRVKEISLHSSTFGAIVEATETSNPPLAILKVTVSPNSGGGASFLIFADLSFRQAELSIGDDSLAFGVKEVSLEVTADGCRIAPAPRFEEKQGHSEIRQLPPNTWKVTASTQTIPIGTDLLSDRPLWLVEILSSANARVKIQALCRISDLVVQWPSRKEGKLTRNKRAIVATVLAKSLNASDGKIPLSGAIVTIREE
jgi:glycosyltransferase involved in cell wall biosynthesis